MNKLVERLDAWARGEIELAPVTGLFGMRPVAWRDGVARIEMQADTRHHNAMGTVHGGVFCDLADVAIGAAMASVLADGETFTSVELHMTYLRPAVAGLLAADAKLIRRGQSVAYLECEVLDGDGKLLAKGTSICIIRSK